MSVTELPEVDIKQLQNIKYDEYNVKLIKNIQKKELRK